MSARWPIVAAAAISMTLVGPGLVKHGSADPAPGGAAENVPTTTPIKHVIVLMQDNHSFDNYFGTYPGADGIDPSACQATDPGVVGSPCIHPFHLTDEPIVGLDDSRSTFSLQFDHRRLDGFVHAFRVRNRSGFQAMGYYNGDDIPLYWNMADHYVLFDRFFASSPAGSEQKRPVWISGSLRNPAPGVDPVGNRPTIFDRLEDARLSWRFYVEDYVPEGGETSPDDLEAFAAVPLLRSSRFARGTPLGSHIVGLDRLYRDLQTGALPSVSYVAPTSSSEKPPAGPRPGQRLVRGVINALMASKAWDSSAVLVTYDSWGGWYDHVPPPIVQGEQLGFRVPALLVSAYARQGFVDHTHLDHASILRFIESNYGLQPLTPLDARAGNLTWSFDFTRPPRPPQILSFQRGPTAEPKRAPEKALLRAYGLGIGLAVFLILLASVRRLVSARRSRTVVIPLRIEGPPR